MISHQHLSLRLEIRRHFFEQVMSKNFEDLEYHGNQIKIAGVIADGYTEQIINGEMTKEEVLKHTLYKKEIEINNT
jgi:hypothetical protein